MKLLLDANLSPRVAHILRDKALDAIHVRDHGLQRATDAQILRFARDQDLVVISEDTDFGELLATTQARRPSLVLVRSGEPLTPDDHAALLTANIPLVFDDLKLGAIVVLERSRMRVRHLPLLPRPRPSAGDP